MGTDNNTRSTEREPQTTKPNPMQDVRKHNDTPEKEIQRPQNTTTPGTQPERMEKDRSNPQGGGNPNRTDNNPGDRPNQGDGDQRGTNR